MADKKSGKASAKKKSLPKSKAQITKKTAKSVIATAAAPTEAKTPFFKAIFARKHDDAENVITAFKQPAFYAALIGEFIGTFLLAAFLLTFGIQSPIYIIFILLPLTLGFYTLSGSHFNPLITAGMALTRRISAIRAILYIVMQVLGAWLGFLMMSFFAGEAAKSESSPLNSMTKLAEDKIGIIIAVELIGAIIIGLFYARALIYKKHAFMFSAIVAGGVMVAVMLMLAAVSIRQLRNVFILNPAVAMVYQILPSNATEIGAAIKDIALALGVYFVVPMLGGTIGFYLSDLATKLSGGDLK